MQTSTEELDRFWPWFWARCKRQTFS